MAQVVLQVDDTTFASLRRDPDSFVRELRLAAAVKWYELRRVSQERAAHIAGLSRAAFLDALGDYVVTPFQADLAEVIDEATRDE